MRKRYRYRKNPLVVFGSFLLIFSILLSVCYCRMRPVIIRYAESVAETILLDSANEAVISVLSDNNIAYNDIITLTKNDDGYVTSLETDIKEINFLKSGISNRLSEIINEKERYNVRIPAGTFLNNVYTAGWGPDINLNMQLTSTAVVTFDHEFRSAGINQVLHIITVNMDITASLILAGYSDTLSVSTSAIAAQTVVMGVVPGAFTNVIESEEDDTGGLINDYGAGNLN